MTKIFLPKITELAPKASPFELCLRKNYVQQKAWAEVDKTDCFRIYDKEVPEYPLAIDYYAGRFCVQYFARGRGDEKPALELEQKVVRMICKIFGCRPDRIYWRTRARSKETRQYEKMDQSGDFFTVYEGGVKFTVNLRDYLDTGLFLDHRTTRKMVASCSKAKRLLNLFAYTCSFSVQAAVLGSTFTKSVDMSNTYTLWGEDNFLLNNLSLKNNPVIRADCLKFLGEEIRSGCKYDVIVIDPPTISRSTKMDQLFDIQQDYVFLITSALKLLNKGGCIFFSTNSQKFVFDSTLFSNCLIKEISDQTIPPDFHDPKIHRCWKIEHY